MKTKSYTPLVALIIASISALVLSASISIEDIDKAYRSKGSGDPKEATEESSPSPSGGSSGQSVK